MADMRPSCIHYYKGRLGAYCKKKESVFETHESGIILPICRKCPSYKYRRKGRGA